MNTNYTLALENLRRSLEFKTTNHVIAAGFHAVVYALFYIADILKTK